MGEADFVTGQDLRDFVLSHGHQTVASTDDYATIVEGSVLKAYWDFIQLEPWWFSMASRPGILNIEASQDVTVNSISGTTVTLSANITATQIFKRFALKSNQVAYRIAAHTGGTAALTLDAPYVETETSGPGVIFQDEYAMASDALKPWGPMDVRSSFQWKVDRGRGSRRPA